MVIMTNIDSVEYIDSETLSRRLNKVIIKESKILWQNLKRDKELINTEKSYV